MHIDSFQQFIYGFPKFIVAGKKKDRRYRYCINECYDPRIAGNSAGVEEKKTDET